MGWRERMGVERLCPAEDLRPDVSLPVAVTEAQVDDSFPKYQIEKLEECLHGRKCKNLVSLPPARPLCRISGEPIFDLKDCPDGLWRAWKQGAVTEYILTTGRDREIKQKVSP
jgi:hypothetical protein